MSKKNFENEEWRSVAGYEEFYAVSNLGRVKSIERTCKHSQGGVRRVREKILKPTLSGRKGYEYFYVTLHKNGVEKSWKVHQLVALAFPEICGLPFEDAEVNHIDENHFNNVPENLNWLSRPDNCNHGTRNERIAKAMSKTVYQYTTAHELVKEWQSTIEIERQTGWHHQSISNCCLGKLKTAYNYIWSYTPLQKLVKVRF